MWFFSIWRIKTSKISGKMLVDIIYRTLELRNFKKTQFFKLRRVVFKKLEQENCWNSNWTVNTPIAFQTLLFFW